MYSRYSYLYPPRPKHKIDPDNLCNFDNNIFLAQPKLNGSCCLVFTNGEEVIIKNRHKNDFSNFKIDKQEFLKIFRGTNSKWSVYVGEYMNKSQKDEKNKIWNQKFVIFDILVFDNNLLIKNNYFERQQLLENLYPNNQTKPLLHEITNTIWRVDNIFSNFKEMFDNIIKYQMFEGLVLKKKNSILRDPLRLPENNCNSMLKCRKPTKNYNY